jgi:hypothetical protein
MERLANYAVALLIAVALIWFTVRYGPRPDGSGSGGAPELAAAPADGSVVQAVAPLGLPKALVAKGCDPTPPKRFFDSLESQYRREGYFQAHVASNGDPAAPVPNQPAGAAHGVFFRLKLGEADSVWRIDRQKTPVEFVVTAGRQQNGCGTQWEMYRANRGSIATPAAGAAEGLPMPPNASKVVEAGGDGLRKFVSFQAAQSARDLRAWYSDSHNHGWQAQGIAPGSSDSSVIYLTRDTRYCMILLPDAASGPATAGTVFLISGSL